MVTLLSRSGDRRWRCGFEPTGAAIICYSAAPSRSISERCGRRASSSTSPAPPSPALPTKGPVWRSCSSRSRQAKACRRRPRARHRAAPRRSRDAAECSGISAVPSRSRQVSPRTPLRSDRQDNWTARLGLRSTYSEAMRFGALSNALPLTATGSHRPNQERIETLVRNGNVWKSCEKGNRLNSNQKAAFKP